MKNFMVKLVILVVALTVGLTTQASAASSSAYKNADNRGKMLTDLRAQFEDSIDAGNLELIDLSYDDFSAEIRTMERAIGKVPGAKNRKALLEKYVTPAKVAKERVIYEVSQLRLLSKISSLQLANQFDVAEQEYAKLKRLKKRAIEIKEAGGYEQLPEEIGMALEFYEEQILKVFEAYKNGDQVSILINLLYSYGYLYSSTPDDYFILGAAPDVENGFWLGYQSPTFGDEIFMGKLLSFDGVKGTYEYDVSWDDEVTIQKGEFEIVNGVLTLHFVDYNGNDVAVTFELF